MGVSNCCQKPVPPPNQDIIGEWLLNSRSRRFHIGSGDNRYKKGSNVLGTGLTGPPSEASVCRLIINQDGVIRFYEYTSECWTVIEGPVYSWQHGKIKSIQKSCLKYDDSLVKQKNILIINQMVLKRLQDTLQS